MHRALLRVYDHVLLMPASLRLPDGLLTAQPRAVVLPSGFDGKWCAQV